MRVALVHDWLTGMRGGERCLEALCEMYPDADLYTLIYLPDKVSSTIRAAKVRASWVSRLPGIGHYYRYCLPIFPHVAESFELTDYELIVSSSHCVAKGIFPGKALHVAYIHSPMRYVWDMHGAYFGADASWLARTGMAVWRNYLQGWDMRSAERVGCFVASSKHIAGKIKNFYGRDSVVIHPPVDLTRFSIGRTPDDPYFLIVSALVPYKRIELAVEAFSQMGLPLKIAGDGPLAKSLKKRAAANVEFLGWVDDARLGDLYRGCEAVIFPGEEDFGIVPLESQASGKPVIAYGRGGVRESVIGIDDFEDSSAGKPTGIFFMDSTVSSLIVAVERYRKNKHRFDPAVLRRHASRFSHGAFKSQMKQLIETKLLERSRAGTKC